MSAQDIHLHFEPYNNPITSHRFNKNRNNKMSDGENKNIAYDPTAQAAIDLAYQKVVNEGACACCINPLVSSIYTTGNEIIWRCSNSSCCCKLRYCCPFMFAHCLGLLNEFLMCCEKKVSEGKETIEKSGTDNDDAKACACVMGTCILLIVPIILVECITINLTYYSCCIPCCPGANNQQVQAS